MGVPTLAVARQAVSEAIAETSVVTIKDLWQAQQSQTSQLTNAMNAVETSLARLTGHLEAIDQRNIIADQQRADFESRIRALERWRYALPASMLLGVGSAVAAVLAAVHR